VAFDAIYAGDIWVHEMARGTSLRLTLDGDLVNTTWTADGTKITFQADANIMWMPSDGSGKAEVLLEREHTQWPLSWSRDGRWLAYTETHPDSGRDIWILPVDGEPVSFEVTPADEGAPKFSPDGNWIVYRSDESGRNEIYIRPFPGPGGKWLISTSGGTEPTWAVDGTELFYREDDAMMAVKVTLGDTFSASKPVLLFRGDFKADATGHPLYDVHPDGRFLMARETAGESLPQINVVLNWFDELKRLAPLE
jgi:serine/threonine-protein kinase